MNRRTFVKLAGGAVAAWPLTAFGQQPAHMRRIGALMYLSENDPESKLYTAALQEGLQKLGWSVGRNLEIDYRWTSGDASSGSSRQQINSWSPTPPSPPVCGS